MITKKEGIVFLLCSVALAANAQFELGFNKVTGAICNIVNPDDQHRMNWVLASGDDKLTWQKPEHDWGLGKYDVKELNVENESWIRPVEQRIEKKASVMVYTTKCLDVAVSRTLRGKRLVETFAFTNTTGRSITVSGLSIYTPLNDNYPDATTAGTNRCNAHVWPGLNASYVNAVRMNGVGPHLGLVLTKGAIQSYSIVNRDRHQGVQWKYTASNVRGVITLDAPPFTLEANGCHTIQWTLFWHDGWDNFYANAKQLGFIRLEAEKYTLTKGEPLVVHVDAPFKTGSLQKSITLTPYTLGEHRCVVAYDKGRKRTHLSYYVVSSPDTLIKNRVHFIVDRQQMNLPTDPRNGAYMVYDNDADTIFTNNKLTAASDKDEGRERVGMGVLVAKWLQKNPDEKVKASLMRYVQFVREKLQTPEYKVFSTVDHKSRHRGYNYPWVAHLYLETYRLTKDKAYLKDMYGTYKTYFALIGHRHYSIDFRVVDALSALNEAGMRAQRDSLLDNYTRMADFFVETGIHYPSHEVNYEQSIVAPSVAFLCEMYMVTKNQTYLDAATAQLPSLEAFNGRQPDVHLHEIAIRHWDGYWFGKKAMWGDTMPHYWSTLTAKAYHAYWACTGLSTYRDRARRIVENNLLNFKEDGRASCAYLYPSTINGQPGSYYDSFANDQDWAMVFFLEVMEDKYLIEK